MQYKSHVSSQPCNSLSLPSMPCNSLSLPLLAPSFFSPSRIPFVLLSGNISTDSISPGALADCAPRPAHLLLRCAPALVPRHAPLLPSVPRRARCGMCPMS